MATKEVDESVVRRVDKVLGEGVMGVIDATKFQRVTDLERIDAYLLNLQQSSVRFVRGKDNLTVNELKEMGVEVMC